MLQLAHDGLDEDALKVTLLSQASGPFFAALPTSRYGGTPLAYACAFCLRRAVSLLLSLSARSPKLEGAVSLNDPLSACTLSGFLPLHAVVANGRCAMYDFLVELPGMPAHHMMRASEYALSQPGEQAQMTPLQLACWLGDHRMCRHIMTRRSEVVWKWGPITQYKIPLLGIDSAGGGGNDVMEIIGRLDASTKTREMLVRPDCEWSRSNQYSITCAWVVVRECGGRTLCSACHVRPCLCYRVCLVLNEVL